MEIGGSLTRMTLEIKRRNTNLNWCFTPNRRITANACANRRIGNADQADGIVVRRILRRTDVLALMQADAVWQVLQRMRKRALLCIEQQQSKAKRSDDPEETHGSL